MAALSVKRSRMQFANISSSTPYQWKPSLPESGCKHSTSGIAFGHVPNEDVECKFQHLECSMYKTGMVLDSVQKDVMCLNRAMKDAALESNSTQKKVDVLQRSLQEICKGQDDLKELVESCTKINPDQMNVMNSRSSNLNEISLTLSAWPKQIQADLRLLQSDISSALTEEMQSIVRAIGSSEGRADAIEMPLLSDPMPEVNEKPLVNQTTEVNGRSLVSTTPIENEISPLNQTPVVNKRPRVSQIPVANERSLVRQTPVVNDRPLVNQTPLANGRSLKNQKPIGDGRPQMKQNPVASGQLTFSQRQSTNLQKSQISATKVLPTHSVGPTMETKLNMDVGQGKVKEVSQNIIGSSSGLETEHDDMSKRQVIHQLTKKEPVCMIIDSDGNSEECVYSMILSTKTADVESHLIKEATEQSVQILKTARKRRRENKAIVPVKGVLSETARSSGETGSGLWKRILAEIVVLQSGSMALIGMGNSGWVAFAGWNNCKINYKRGKNYVVCSFNTLGCCTTDSQTVFFLNNRVGRYFAKSFWPF